MRKNKILIIKTGYSEVLDRESNSRKVSFGDILRITPLLHVYKNDSVTWVSDENAFPLLENNPYISRLLPLDWIVSEQLKAEEFDKVINLEKIPGICALADSIRARRARYGFTFNSQTGGVEAYDKSGEVIEVSYDIKLKRENKRTAQAHLFEMVGEKWNGEEYVLGYTPKTKEKYTVGLNTQVGQKWPTKSWADKNWDRLEEMLKEDCTSVSRQDKQDNRVLRNLYEYMDWINSCKTIVTNDSLGLHVAIALKKKVLGLFGATPHAEVYFYERGKAILPEPVPDCLPCFESVCGRGHNCLEDITPERVLNEIRKYAGS